LEEALAMTDEGVEGDGVHGGKKDDAVY
jgi:hypothetical protein